jgi:hypothetical protein
MTDYTDISLKGSLSIFILVICYKIYKMKIKTHSGCCGEKIIIETENTGGRDIELGGV